MKILSALSQHVRSYPFLAVVTIVLCSLAVVTRFYDLGVVPHGITWDEAAMGYNGYSVITTRRDEWLQKLPVSFQSYGDYKAPLAIYWVGVSTVLFGMTPFAVRLPFAFSSVLFIASFAWLVNELFCYSKYRKYLTVIGALFAITTPWDFHYARIGFESGMALSFIVFSLAIFIHLVNTYEDRKLDIKGTILLFVSGFAATLSLYTYHSAKIFIPLFFIYLAMSSRKFLLDKKIASVSVALLCFLALLPLAWDSLHGSGAERANVLILSQGLSLDKLLLVFLSNFAQHFDIHFLLFSKVDVLRHGIGKWGVLTPVSLVLSLVGLASFVIKKSATTTARRNVAFLAITVIIIGVVPAALSAETVPHTNRALLALPGFLLLALVGIDQLISLPSTYTSKLAVRSIVGTVILVECLWFISTWQYYFTDFAVKSAPDFQDGYIEAFNLAQEYEKGLNGKPEVQRIEFSSEYGQPYMYALFVKKTSPIYYRGGALNKYLFEDKISQEDLNIKNILIVTTPSQNFPIEKATQVVMGTDGKPRFLLFYTGM